MRNAYIIAGILPVVLGTPVLGAPQQCPATGNWYEIVPEFKTWPDADAAAQASSYLGAPGHLVTITSLAEQQWFTALLQSESPDQHVHAGGVQDPGGVEPGDGWGWVTSEAMIYLNWYPGEPNQYNGTNEDTMFIFRGAVPEAGQWADGLAGQARWYAVEYEVPPVPTEATTWGAIRARFR